MAGNSAILAELQKLEAQFPENFKNYIDKFATDPKHTTLAEPLYAALIVGRKIVRLAPFSMVKQMVAAGLTVYPGITSADARSALGNTRPAPSPGPGPTPQNVNAAKRASEGASAAATRRRLMAEFNKESGVEDLTAAGAAVAAGASVAVVAKVWPKNTLMGPCMIAMLQDRGIMYDMNTYEAQACALIAAHDAAK